MSSFLYGFGRWAFRRRIAILVTWLTVLVLLGGLAAVGGKKFDESFSLPGTESQTALDSLSRTFPQASGALTTAAPHTFAAIAPFLPLTPALQGARAVVSGGSGGPAAMGLLLAWLLLAVSISVLAVARQRMLPAAMSTVRQIVAGSPGR